MIRSSVHRHATAWIVSSVLLGVLLRVAVASESGIVGDLANILDAGRALEKHGLLLYGVVNPPAAPIPGYPYPPGFLPWAWVSAQADPQQIVARLPQILCDASIGWIVAREVRRRTGNAEAALLATWLIAFNPLLIALAGSSGQLDAVAMLPAIVGVLVWQRGVRHRALYAGVLIGIGATIKLPPLFVLLALAPTARGLPEILRAAAAAAAPLLAAIAPFAVTDPGGLLRALSYSGLPGQGGLSALLQPSLVRQFPAPPLNEAVLALDRINLALVVIGAAGVVWLLRRHRASAVESAAVLGLVIYLTGVHWFDQYAVWTLPFLVLLRANVYVLALSAVYAIYAWPSAGPLWSKLGLPWNLPVLSWHLAAWLAWFLWAVGLAWLLRRITSQPDDHLTATTSPVPQQTATA